MKGKKHKKTKKPKYKADKNRLFPLFFLLLCFLIIAFLGSIMIPKLFSDATSKNQKTIVLKSLSLPTVTSSSTVTQLPTPTQIPTPTPYSGFCLKVPVLMYHHVQPSAMAKEKGQSGLTVDSGIFDQQMGYLVSNGYTSISGLQLIEALRNHTPLAPKSVVITLDDGYRDAYEYAYQILQKYHLTANMAIPTGLMEGTDYLTWGQIQEMSRSGLIYFMDHTWSHSSLGNADINKIKYEVETAKQQLEQKTGQGINIFVYPYGSFGNNVINVLQQDGFVGAFSTIQGLVQCDTFIMDLHRTRIGNTSLSYYGL
ncbi:MAG: polysaccharide deacetylase family protein [bacterium]|nr:polysaccharide deacetylase family protein [bacterium]